MISNIMRANGQRGKQCNAFECGSFYGYHLSIFKRATVNFQCAIPDFPTNIDRFTNRKKQIDICSPNQPADKQSASEQAKKKSGIQKTKSESKRNSIRKWFKVAAFAFY